MELLDRALAAKLGGGARPANPDALRRWRRLAIAVHRVVASVLGCFVGVRSPWWVPSVWQCGGHPAVHGSVSYRIHTAIPHGWS